MRPGDNLLLQDCPSLHWPDALGRAGRADAKSTAWSEEVYHPAILTSPPRVSNVVMDWKTSSGFRSGTRDASIGRTSNRSAKTRRSMGMLARCSSPKSTTHWPPACPPNEGDRCQKSVFGRRATSECCRECDIWLHQDPSVNFRHTQS